MEITKEILENILDAPLNNYLIIIQEKTKIV